MYVFAVVLIVVWLLGWISDFTLGGFIHLFLLAAVILIASKMVHGHKKLKP